MLGQVVSIAAIIWGVALMMNRKTKFADAHRRLSFGERLQIITICLFSPVISGLIFYYGWKQTLPMMAKQAGMIAFVVLLLELLLGFALGYLIYFAS
jgi:hypothetical protein